MFGVLAFEIGFHGLVGAGPEAGEVLRHLDRAPSGRKQMQKDCDPPASHARCLGGAEHFLQPHGEDRPHDVTVIQWHARPRRHIEMGGGETVQRLALLPVEGVDEGGVKIEPVEMRTPRNTVELRP